MATRTFAFAVKDNHAIFSLRNAYMDATEDATWFGQKNILPTLAVYREAGIYFLPYIYFFSTFVFDFS